MPDDPPRLALAALGERAIDALGPALRRPEGVTTWHVQPTWSQVWSDVRSVYGPIRSALFIAIVVASFPVILVWNACWILAAKVVIRLAPGLTSANQVVAIVTAILITLVLGGGALWIWGWPGLLVVCLFVWLFT